VFFSLISLHGTGFARLANKVAAGKEVIWNVENIRRGKLYCFAEPVF